MIAVKNLFLATGLVLGAWNAGAQPIASSPAHTRALAASCAACHGTDGRAAEGSAVPGLAGVPKATLIAQMNAFKDGSRPATIMHQLSKGYTDEQINLLGDYFAAVKR